GRADVASPRPARHLPTTTSGARRPSSAGTISKTASIDRQGEGSRVIANGTTSGGSGPGDVRRPLRGRRENRGRLAGRVLAWNKAASAGVLPIGGVDLRSLRSGAQGLPFGLLPTRFGDGGSEQIWYGRPSHGSLQRTESAPGGRSEE